LYNSTAFATSFFGTPFPDSYLHQEQSYVSD
jgi:hypothetical protein